MIQEIITYIIIAIFIGISQSAGIGGGPILNICLMIGFDYSAKTSMSITYLFLLGGSTASMMKNFPKKNQKTGGPLMDYTLIAMTLPMSAAGSIIGTILNHYISQFIVTILFTILLTYLSFDTYKKLKSYGEKDDNKISKPLISQMKEFGTGSSMSPQLRLLLQKGKEKYPTDKIKLVCGIFLYTVVVLLARGGETYESWVGLESCGIGGFILILIHLILGYLLSKSVAIKKTSEEAEMQRLGYVFEDEKNKMNSEKMWASMISGLFAGMIGGALGLGGAIILVPVWLNQGIDKNIATSSSGPLIFFSALVAFFMAFLCDMYDDALSLVFYFVLAFISSALIKEIANYIAKRFKLETMIYILLLITMVSSLVVLLPFQLSRYYDDPEEFMEFGVFC